MVRILTGIYTVKIYQGPVCIVEDILHLDIVMGSADTIFSEDWKKKKTYRLYKKKYSCMDILLKILQVNSQSYVS